MMKFFHSLHPFHAATLHSQSFTPTLPLPQLTLTDPISLFGFHFYYRFFNLTHSLISHSPTVSVLHLISLVIITLSIYFRASNFHLLNINVYYIISTMYLFNTSKLSLNQVTILRYHHISMPIKPNVQLLDISTKTFTRFISM